MTNIYINKIGNEMTISAEGHAGYAERGTDIVCASISVLLQSFEAYCMENPGKVIIKNHREEDGYFYMYVAYREPVILEALKMLIYGLKGISESYPEYVDISLHTLWEKSEI